MLDRFDVLVKEQMKTMEKLLLLQQEIERCQQMEKRIKRTSGYCRNGKP
ncbi:YgaB family protein [Bacillus smithii]